MKSITVPFRTQMLECAGDNRYYMTDIHTGEEHIVFMPPEIRGKMHEGYVPFQKLNSVMDLEVDGENIIRFKRRQDLEYTIRCTEDRIAAGQKFLAELIKSRDVAKTLKNNFI